MGTRLLRPVGMPAVFRLSGITGRAISGNFRDATVTEIVERFPDQLLVRIRRLDQ